RVADGGHVFERHVQALADFHQHAGIGLAIRRIGIRPGGAIENRVDAAAGMGDLAVHLVVYRVERRHIEQAATDAGLIGRHHYAITRLRETRDGLHATGYGYPFVRAFDELRTVVIDDAVAVEND